MPCVKCREPIQTKKVIYIREKVEDRWGSHPICDNCWYKEHPNREPVRVIRNE